MSDKVKYLISLFFLCFFVLFSVNNAFLSWKFVDIYQKFKIVEFYPSSDEMKFKIEDKFIYYPNYLEIEEKKHGDDRQILFIEKNVLQMVLEYYPLNGKRPDCDYLREANGGVEELFFENCSISKRKMRYKSTDNINKWNIIDTFEGSSDIFDHLEVYTDGVYFIYPIPMKSDIEASSERKKMAKRLMHSLYFNEE